jgi:CRP/FNR family cyclic AMP-dependent transcriptional regulator
MALLKVILVAEDVSGCSTFSCGEQVTIDYPRVVIGESDKICVIALDQCAAYILPLSRGVAFATLGIGEQTGTMRCCCPQGSVVFKVFKQYRRLSTSPDIQRHLGLLKLDIPKLQAMPIFTPLPPQSLEKIIPFLQLKRVKAGTEIIRQGDVGESLHVIVKGEVLVVREDTQRGEELLATLAAGECFGEMSLISGEPVSATIRAKTAATLLLIGKNDFDYLLLETPSLNVYFTKLLTQRLQQANTRMMEMLDQGILGSVKTFSIPELVQTLSLNRRTGILVFTERHARGEVFFQEGSIHQVSLNDLDGEEAFYRLLEWQEGQFQFQPAEPFFIPRKIHKDTMQLLMEGLRQLDEKREFQSQSESSS